MTLSLTIGSGPMSLNQASYGGQTYSAPIQGVLPVPSTAGACLVLILCSCSGSSPTVNSVKSGNPRPGEAGWVRQVAKTQGSQSNVEVWAFPANPGGITTVNVSVSGGSQWFVYTAEFLNVDSISAIEASGTASATSGTTLALTTSGNVVSAGDIALAVWVQRIAAAATVSFTSPGGWTRAADDTGFNSTDHFNIETLGNPTTGAPLSATLTSDHTTTSAAGIILVLKAAAPSADQSTYLRYDSLSVKLNTLDFTLVDCPTAVPIFGLVTLSSPGELPDWTGQVGAVRAVDLVDRATGHHLQVVTATNTQAPNYTNSPINLSDNPAIATNDIWLLENGDMFALENGAGDWLLESSVQEFSYQALSVGTQVATVSPVTYTTIGEVTVFQSGMWPGMLFYLTSSNLNSWIRTPGAYLVQTIVVTYQGVNPPTPVYRIQFGDLPVQTLAEWTAAHA